MPRDPMRSMVVVTVVLAAALSGCLWTEPPGSAGDEAGETNGSRKRYERQGHGHFVVKGTTEPPCNEGKEWQWMNYYSSPTSERILACWNVPSPNASSMRWRIAKPNQGNFSVKVTDGSGEVFYHEEWGQGAGTDCQDEGRAGEPGRWTINVTLRSVQGRARVLFHTDDRADCPT